MDKNKLIGLGIIGFLLVAIGLFNRNEAQKAHPKEVQKTAQKASADQHKTTLAATAKDATTNKQTTAKSTDAKKQVPKSDFKPETIQLKTDKTTYEFSTKGGILTAVTLNEFVSYDNYHAKKDIPMALFAAGDNVNQLVFDINGKPYTTGNKQFFVVEKTDNRLVLQTNVNAQQSIQFIYTANKGTYNLDYDIKLKGFGNSVQPNSVMLSWKTDYLKTERLLRNERMVSTICYKTTDGKEDYLSQGRDDSKTDFDNNFDWLVYKQSYFSAIMKPSTPFLKDGTKLSIHNYKEGIKMYNTHIMHYASAINLGVSNANDASVHISWMFLPNKLDLLKSYGQGYEGILNFGWGIFKWINLYIIHPLFETIASTGVGYGLVILILTFIIKLVLTPVQWKMYVSGAKMRILKPELEEINKKYPKKEDAMKKQMETMALYRESGASPFSGCVPMLFQMPLLFAVFRYFPASFDLRQQPFLWADDLSTYDSIWNFGKDIPLYGDHVSLFTLLMAATTMIYTVYNSSNMQQPTQPGMPNMKVIMYIMPLTMVFFFNNYSSGLSFYYFISTLMSILTMFAIKMFFIDEEKLKAKMAAQKADAQSGPKKKSKFQERLEMMQKMQAEQQRSKNKKK